MPTHHATTVADAHIAETAVVAAVTTLTPRMRRVRLAASGLTAVAIYPGQDFTLRVPDGEITSKRRYTVRTHDRAAGTVDIDVVVHGHGPGGVWASHVRPGDDIEITGPRGKVRLADAASHLFVADEAGLPAVAVMAEALPATARARAFLEVADAAEEQPVVTAGLDVTWLHRDGGEPGRSRVLIDAIAAAGLSGVGAAYIFTESRLARELRLLLLDRGLPQSTTIAKGYWNLPH